jgi:hypothetical protein
MKLEEEIMVKFDEIKDRLLQNVQLALFRNLKRKILPNFTTA